MTMHAHQAQFTGRHMLLIMVAFFGTVFAANMALVFYSSHSWTGLVVENSYVASQEFDKTTRKLELAEAGVHTKIAYAKGQLSLTLTDNDGNPAIASNVVAKLGRPSHEGEDQTIPLVAKGDGLFVADLVLGKGQWSGMVTADVAHHESWQRPLRILVKE